MKKLLAFLFIVVTACNIEVKKENSSESESKKNDSLSKANLEQSVEDLKSKGYKTFTYKEGDTTYLMQQYYLVFLKAGPNRNQDSIELVNLQKQHLAHLERMGKEGYASLIGPLEGDSDILGIAVYNTPTQKEADSLAKLDPMVKAGRLEVEIHPWWTAKGGKLN